MKTNLFKKALKAVKNVIGTNTRKPAVKIITANVEVTMPDPEPVITKLYPIFDEDGYFDGYNYDHPVIDEIIQLENENGDLSCELDNDPDNPINKFIALCQLDDHDAKFFKAILSNEISFCDAISILHSGDWEFDENITDEYDLAERFFEEDGIDLGGADGYFDFEGYATDRARGENGTLTEYGYYYKI